MRGDEMESLREQKFREGKDSEEVNYEIENLKESQIVLKNSKKEIKNLNKENEKLSEENKFYKNKIFKLNLRLDSIEKPQEEDNSKYLKMIMLMLKKDKLTATEIAEKCGTQSGKIMCCLKFLVKYNLLQSKSIMGGKRYWQV